MEQIVVNVCSNPIFFKLQFDTIEIYFSHVIKIMIFCPISVFSVHRCSSRDVFGTGSFKGCFGNNSMNSILWENQYQFSSHLRERKVDIDERAGDDIGDRDRE